MLSLNLLSHRGAPGLLPDLVGVARGSRVWEGSGWGSHGPPDGSRAPAMVAGNPVSPGGGSGEEPEGRQRAREGGGSCVVGCCAQERVSPRCARQCSRISSDMPRAGREAEGPRKPRSTRRSLPAAAWGPGRSRRLDARVTELAVPGELQPRRAHLPGRETLVEQGWHRDGNGRGDTVRAGRGCAEKQWPPGPGVRAEGVSAGPSPPQALVTTASQWARQTSGCPVGRAGRVHPCGPGTRAVTSSRLGRVHVGACGHLLEFLHASITGRARSCVHRPPCGSTSMYNQGCRQQGPRSVLGPTAEPVREGPFDKLQYQFII